LTFFYLSRNELGKLKTHQLNRINNAIKKEGSGDRMAIATWHANSCYIDCVVEFLQRVAIPVDPFPGDGNESDDYLTKLINEWKRILLSEGEVMATWHLRSDLWKYHNQVKYGEQNDCLLVLEYLTKEGPLSPLFSFTYSNESYLYELYGAQKYAFVYLFATNIRTLQQEFNQYFDSSNIKVPSILTVLNCMDDSKATYDYPDVITIKHNFIYYEYKICARIMKQDIHGEHFYTLLDIDGKTYQCDNINSTNKNGPRLVEKDISLSGKLFGPLMYTAFVFYKLVNPMPSRYNTDHASPTSYDVLPPPCSLSLSPSPPPSHASIVLSKRKSGAVARSRPSKNIKL
jgi:hypothetical protein